jgi:hypothetical protein
MHMGLNRRQSRASVPRHSEEKRQDLAGLMHGTMLTRSKDSLENITNSIQTVT